MNASFKFATLAALTAATIALPAAAQDANAAQPNCHPKASASKCGAKCAPTASGKCAPKASQKKAKCAPAKSGAKCAPKCGAKG